MKKSPLACVHCPHCDHHLCTWGDVQEAIRQAEAHGIPAEDGWTVCPACTGVIRVERDGEHVAPTPEQIAAQTPQVRGAIDDQVWFAKTIQEGLKRGVLVGFKRVQAMETITAEEPKASASQGSSMLH